MCRNWPREYGEVWDQVYRRAESRVIAELGAEAEAVLRKLTHSADKKIARDAQRTLNKYCRKRE